MSKDLEALKTKVRGDVANEKRAFFAAHAYYDEAIRLSPREMVFYYDKSLVFFKQRKYNNCIATCEKALNVGSKDKKLVLKVMRLIAKARANQGENLGAIDRLEKALSNYRGPIFEITGIIAYPRPTPTAVQAYRLPLNPKYALNLICLHLEIPLDGARLRNLAFSSPSMMAGFLAFLTFYEIVIRDSDDVFFFSRDTNATPRYPVYTIKWASFSWMTPFIADLTISGEYGKPQKWVYEMLPKTGNVLCFFRFWMANWIHEPMHPNVLPFIRRQLPNLRTLHGPVEFFFELPPNPAEPKKFENVSLVVPRFLDLPKLFQTKRFTSTTMEFEFVQPPNGGINYASNFMTFLKKLTIRMPETDTLTIRLPVLNARFPASDLVKLLLKIFSGLRYLRLIVHPSAFKKIESYDRKRLIADNAFLMREVKKMPSHLCVHFDFDETAEFVDFNAGFAQLSIDVPRGFTLLDRRNQKSMKSPSARLTTKNYKVAMCHGNKFFTYDVVLK